MTRKIAIVGTGAVGGYTGAHMVQAGEDVTFIDPWPAIVETHAKPTALRVTHVRRRAGMDHVRSAPCIVTELQQAAPRRSRSTSPSSA